MSNNYICKTCGRAGYIGPTKTIKHVYESNLVDVFFGDCLRCGGRVAFVKSPLIEEFIFPDFRIVEAQSAEVNNIYVSYVPIYSFLEENKSIILEKKKSDDIIIGFEGWEDYVLDRSISGGWYMTQNSPPMLDVAVNQIRSYMTGNRNILYSYFPSALVSGLSLKYSLIDCRGVAFFEETKHLMIEQYRNFYIGVK